MNGKAAALEGGGKGIAGAATVGGSGGKVSQQPASSSFSLAYQAKNALVWGLSKVIRLVDGSARQRYGWCAVGPVRVVRWPAAFQHYRPRPGSPLCLCQLH